MLVSARAISFVHNARLRSVSATLNFWMPTEKLQDWQFSIRAIRLKKALMEHPKVRRIVFKGAITIKPPTRVVGAFGTPAGETVQKMIEQGTAKFTESDRDASILIVP